MMKDNEIRSRKILKGVAAIAAYAGISRATFPDFLEAGLPAYLWRGCWWAHGDNVDEFFRRFTLRRHRGGVDPESLMEWDDSDE